MLHGAGCTSVTLCICVAAATALVVIAYQVCHMQSKACDAHPVLTTA